MNIGLRRNIYRFEKFDVFVSRIIFLYTHCSKSSFIEYRLWLELCPFQEIILFQVIIRRCVSN